jgi:hypothetical protein
VRIPSATRRLIAAFVVAIVLAACGSDVPDSASGATPATNADQQLDRAAAGPGLFELLDLGEGRATIAPPGDNDLVLAPHAAVDFFDGGHRLRVDEHHDLRGELEQYRGSLESRNAGRETWARAHLPDTDPTLYRATIVDLVAALHLPAMPLWGSGDCPQELADARRRHAMESPPSPTWQSDGDGFEVWDYPADALPRLPGCVGEIYDDDLDPSATRLRFRRSLDHLTLDVLFDPGHYQDARFETLLTIVATSEDPAGEAPGEPASSIFDPASVFVLAVNRCGALPWAYSNFMAGDSYTAPIDPGYAEPGPFTTGYVCEDEVPER